MGSLPLFPCFWVYRKGGNDLGVREKNVQELGVGSCERRENNYTEIERWLYVVYRREVRYCNTATGGVQ